MSASSAKYRPFGKLVWPPDFRCVIGDRSVAIETREPPPAAFEPDRDYVERRMPMRTARLAIDVNSVNLAAVDLPHHTAIPSSSSER